MRRPRGGGRWAAQGPRAPRPAPVSSELPGGRGAVKTLSSLASDERRVRLLPTLQLLQLPRDRLGLGRRPPGGKTRPREPELLSRGRIAGSCAGKPLCRASPGCPCTAPSCQGHGAPRRWGAALASCTAHCSRVASQRDTRSCKLNRKFTICSSPPFVPSSCPLPPTPKSGGPRTH